MKIFIDYKLNDTGKGKFIKRLIPALADIGVKCSFKQKGCDIALGLSKWRSKIKIPKVLRLDGIAVDNDKKSRWRNEQIRKSIKQSDAIIYQSKFAKRYIKKHLKIKHKKEYVIYNGANPKDYEIEPMKSPYKYNYLMAARWGNRKHKRLKDHLEYVKIHKEIHFWLAGDCKVESTNNMTVLGYLPDKELRRYQVMADAFVYLVDIDWCANVVVEARMAGLFVIYNQKCESVRELYELDIKELHIDNIARQYKKVFKNVKA